MIKNKFFMYEVFILVGLFIAMFALLKVLGVIYISSDWFWFVAGLGLVVEGMISLVKQKTFDKKYKIVLREENGNI